MEEPITQGNAGDANERWDEESDDDIEAEAEEMARRLQEQLRADIERAQAEARAQALQLGQQVSRTDSARVNESSSLSRTNQLSTLR